VGFYQQQVLPRAMNVLLSGAELGEIRARAGRGMSGEVLEVGFGSGLNVPHYPAEVRRVLAVGPATVGRKLAANRVAESHVKLEYVDLDGEKLPVLTGSIDHVLVTWSLCSIPSISSALRDLHRVLRPGGQLHFAEHGRSPEPKVALWQDRLNPLQRLLAGGCNLNRPVDKLIEEAGFTMARLENFYAKGWKLLNYTYLGVATKT
jgi:SAM-dependent methyltransferase